MKKTLLVLATDLGSRYGRLKQLETFGPNGELLIEYGIYDAIEAGFNKIVFVLKQDVPRVFISLINDIISDLVEVHYVFQDMEDLPLNKASRYQREKSWGTAHAIWCARKNIKEPFLIMNADVFYGKNAFKIASDFFDNNTSNFAVISYQLDETLSDYGGVNRSICFTEKNSNILREIINITGIKRKSKNELIFNTSKKMNKNLALNELASMNMFCLRPSFFTKVEMLLKKFLDNPLNISNEELLIPHVIEYCIKSTNISTTVLNSRADWFGVTYKADRIMATYKIEDKIKQGFYPKKLFRHNNDTLFI